MESALRWRRTALAMAFRLPMASTPQARHAREVLGRSNAARRIICPAGTFTHRSAGPIASRCQPVTPRTAVVAAVASPARDVDARTDTSADHAVFQWTKQWYPLLPLKLLDESQGEGYASGVPEIQRQSILGRDVVLWKDAEGRWRAVEDRCAHRLAALSLGSVKEDGTLACRYHGELCGGECETCCGRIRPVIGADRGTPACGGCCGARESLIGGELHSAALGMIWLFHLQPDSHGGCPACRASNPTDGINAVSKDTDVWIKPRRDETGLTPSASGL